MQNTNRNTQFYIVKSSLNISRYDVYNALTDRKVLEAQERNSVREFLVDNEPTHPMMISLSTGMTTGDLNTRHLYYNSYLNPYGVSVGVDLSNGSSDFSTTYLVHNPTSYTVSDNDLCTHGSILSNTEDCDSGADREEDCYGDSNHLPYIIGQIKS